jgi:hypothetical protein
MMLPTMKTNIALRNSLFVFFMHQLVVGISYIPGIRGVDLIASLSIGDQITYIIPAKNLLINNAFSSESIAPFLWEPYRTPGLPLIICLSILLTKSILLVPIFNAFAAGLATYFLCKLIVHLQFEGSIQNIASIIMAFMPNALGLDCYILTDALLGYLSIIWLYFLITALQKSSLKNALISSSILTYAQLLKPTMSVAIILILIITCIIYYKEFFAVYIRGVIIVCLLSIITPTYLSWQNNIDHGIYTPSLLGERTKREYLTASYIASKTGQEYYSVQEQIRAEDMKDTILVPLAKSTYGKLFLVKKHKDDSLISSDITGFAKILSTEVLKQTMAPQEFIFNVFNLNSIYYRVLGFIINLFFILSFISGIYYLITVRKVKYALIALIMYGFYISAGALSSKQGGRLRFPADVTAIPVIASGIFFFIDKKKKYTRDNNSDLHDRTYI